MFDKILIRESLIKTGVARVESSNVKVILDPGHILGTPGKASPRLANGWVFKEYYSNWSFADGLAGALDWVGIDYAYSTLDIENAAADILPGRIAEINRINAEIVKPCFVLSIHSNAYQRRRNAVNWTRAAGIETFYYADARRYSRAGKKIAVIFQTELIRATGAKDRGIKSNSKFDILEHTTPAAVISEILFFNNKSELNKILSPAFRLSVLQAYVLAILQINKQYQSIF